MQKIILYYKFTPLSDPEMTMLWQKALAQKSNLRGRIIISKHGINGTLGGDLDDLKTYVRESKAWPAFKDTVYKWSDGSRDDFPKLSVKVRDEIVTFGAADVLEVDEHGVVGGGKHLTPAAVHRLVAERGEDVVFFDGRNAYEAKVGAFQNAVVPDTRTTRDFLDDLAGDKYEAIKHKPVVTYCTGGVRCEVLSSLMKKRGFTDVYQLDGGIVNYGKQYADTGLWEGSLYVFDGRMGLKFSDQARDIGVCIHCASSTSRYTNCSIKTCNELIVVCDSCADREKCPDCLAAQKEPENPADVLK